MPGTIVPQIGSAPGTSWKLDPTSLVMYKQLSGPRELAAREPKSTVWPSSRPAASKLCTLESPRINDACVGWGPVTWSPRTRASTEAYPWYSAKVGSPLIPTLRRALWNLVVAVRDTTGSFVAIALRVLRGGSSELALPSRTASGNSGMLN